MRRGLILVLAMVAAILVTATDANTVSCTLSSCPGPRELVATFGGTVSPGKLPRNDYVPVNANVFGRIATTDGTHPSALREAVVDIDKDIGVRVKRLPVCLSGPHYDIREPDGGRSKIEKTCPGALIGRGEAQFEIAFPEQEPIKVTSPLLVINGGEKGGEVTLLIHTFISVPAPTAIVTTVTITRKGSGIHAVAKVPVIAGGSGSLIGFNFKLGKTYSYEGKKVGYFEAKCPDGVFKINFPELLFENEAHTPGVAAATGLKGSQTVPCTPYG
ncbi:MAG TPA: hypothetical protein VK471_00460 [Solirubrobacterales bacterium]|nr:hypothetical protein [Solirubrobacterales bacterium]